MLNIDLFVIFVFVVWYVSYENILASRRVNVDFFFIKYFINRLLKA